jgi:sec-independent protein translocase protein TatC
MSVIRPIGHQDRLSLVEHLDELRKRLIVCIVVFVAAFAVCYSQNNWLLHTINRPLERSQHLDGTGKSKDPLEQAASFEIKTAAALRQNAATFRDNATLLGLLARRGGLSAAERALLTRVSRENASAGRASAAAATAAPTKRTRLPVTLGVTEPFVTTFTIAGYAALLLAMPFLLYQAYAFVLPAFSPRERRVALPLMLMVPFLFVAGVAFGYFLALPRAIDFLQNFNDDSFDILIRAQDYYKFSVLLLALLGLLFQIPVGVLAITRMGLISARTLGRNRGYVILALSVVAAVATPTPDPVTMLVAMAPLVLLFELSVLLARIFERRRERAEEHDDEEDDDDHLDEAWDAVDHDLPVS